MEERNYLLGLLFIFFVFTLSSCSHERYEFVKVKDIEIEKDYGSNILNYFSQNNDDYFTLLNYDSSSINFYNIEL